MIKEKEIKVFITVRNITYYKNLGYDIDKFDTEILVKIEDVNKNSRLKITAICDICEKETKLSISMFPAVCPYSQIELLDEDFYPSK